MTRDQILDRVVKLRALAERPGSPEEGRTAQRVVDELIAEHKITDAEIALATSRAEGMPDVGPSPWARDDSRECKDTEPRRRHGPREPTAEAIEDQRRDRFRTHLAYSDMRAMCGIGPPFNWVTSVRKLRTYANACQHCVDTGIAQQRGGGTELPRRGARRAIDRHGR